MEIQTYINNEIAVTILIYNTNWSLFEGLPATENGTAPSPHRATPVAMNHLFVGKELSENKRVKSAKTHYKPAAGSSEHKVDCRAGEVNAAVQASTPSLSEELSTRLDLYATTAQESGKQTLK